MLRSWGHSPMFCNVCTYINCGAKFATAADLLKHVEQCHVDFLAPVLPAPKMAICNPSRLSRCYPSILLYPQPIDRVILNRMIPEDKTGNSMRDRVPLQPPTQMISRVQIPHVNRRQVYSDVPYTEGNADNHIVHTTFYVCECGKTYKTTNGLSRHISLTQHNRQNSMMSMRVVSNTPADNNHIVSVPEYAIQVQPTTHETHGLTVRQISVNPAAMASTSQHRVPVVVTNVVPTAQQPVILRLPRVPDVRLAVGDNRFSTPGPSYQ
ncbi:hypothetical protein T02_13511 [Trichinella nativa]|uniref:Zinc finger, C2H2 type n=1 Tax=Trichinella nativa TaxID=6335 RepID=A0A0V1LEX2_9BILA|nr:hypothetical protein T06_5094 [Trichinella sp. T6]KRZ58079.1 hypothetical protein T02_13511 [Trichinella nativa]OUC49562.1 zinc finger, C2H2 type [Trichinella nativa]